MDFLTDSLADGRRFQVLTIVDTVSRVCPAIEVGVALTGERLVAVLERLQRTVGSPERMAIDNGPECISQALDPWAYQNGVQLEFSRAESQRTTPALSRSMGGSGTSA
jgi:putative transposase